MGSHGNIKGKGGGNRGNMGQGRVYHGNRGAGKGSHGNRDMGGVTMVTRVR